MQPLSLNPGSLQASALSKGEQTHRAILDMAIDLAAAHGLEGLTIGSLAERLQMSKSGVYAHCGSREELQIAVLRSYEVRFIASVLKPALDVPRGLPRLRTIFGNWLRLVDAEAVSGCIMISAAAEYDDRPGPVREALVRMVRSWQAELCRAIEQTIAAGELPNDASPDAVVFDLQGIVLSLHHDSRLLSTEGALDHARGAFERLIAGYRSHGDRVAGSHGGADVSVSAGIQPDDDDSTNTAAPRNWHQRRWSDSADKSHGRQTNDANAHSQSTDFSDSD